MDSGQGAKRITSSVVKFLFFLMVLGLVFTGCGEKSSVEPDVNADVSPPPALPGSRLIPSVTDLVFEAKAGQEGAATQEILISGAGEESFAWVASPPQSETSSGASASWIKLDEKPGTTPSGLAVTVDAAGMLPGAYTSSFFLSSLQDSASPRKISVTLKVL